MSLRQYSHQWLLCRGDLASHKQQLQEARIKNDEQSHAIMQNEAQMVQLQKEKADVVSSGKQFQQDMVQARLLLSGRKRRRASPLVKQPCRLHR